MSEDIQQTALTEFHPVRMASNYRHGSINPPLESALEMPQPNFDAGHGWFSPRGNSKFTGTRDGFIDFNFSKCTGDTSKWKFAYLHGESEYNIDDKPPEWSRDNWKFNDTRPDNPASTLDDCGLNANNLFLNGRSPVGNNKLRAYTRNKNNLSNRFMWGVMENPKFSKNSYVTHAYNGESHHARASAITFRYKAHLNEDKSSVIGALRDQHGGNPIEAFCLAYVKEGDPKIYLAECITVSKTQCQDKSPYPTPSSKRWLANSKMSEYNLTTTNNNRKVWMEHGPKNNPNWEVYVDGVCTLTVSTRSAQKIWDNKMVCVGFVATSVHSSRQSGYVGSSMWFEMWDVKLLEMEYRGQNQFDTAGGEEDPKYTRVLRPAATINDNFAYYKSASPEYFNMDLVIR